ncbi:MAG: cytochrome-c oxidase, cbb3-type subunit III [Thiobacillaceae bacterium]|nr:cytochrome-c oxidase, cbb3-type subunit III [Thiobacillaceae bacterium]
MAEQHVKPQGPQTTGHVWDGDLQEYNNPLPQWWLYGFYVTILFALVYWIVYPAWPLGEGFTTGLNSITYVNSEGKEETWHWNTRAKLLKETQAAAAQQKPWFDRIAQASYQQIVQDPELMGFVNSAGRALFNDNCAGCHQIGGAGKIGHYPNLADDNWIYGGSFEKIRETIVNGRQGYMPPFAEALSRDQVEALAHYVLSLSGEPHDARLAAEGDKLFHSHTGACYYCHGSDAKGRQDIGAANLTDRIWVWANVPGARDMPAKVAAVRQVILGGLNRGIMPVWGGRLNEEQIKVLTVYVHQLGGGQ